MASAHRAVPQHVNENIENVVELHASLNRRVNRHQRAVEAITHVLGRPATVYAIIAMAAVWVTYNTITHHTGSGELDAPPFFWLQGVLSLYGAMVATMVLTAAIRQKRETEKRAHLEFQLNLLAEQKATKIIALLEELRRDLPNVINRTDALAVAMQEEVDPRAMLSALESTMESNAPPLSSTESPKQP